MAKDKTFQHFIHEVFLVQFGNNLHLRVFHKAEITVAEVARAILAF